MIITLITCYGILMVVGFVALWRFVGLLDPDRDLPGARADRATRRRLKRSGRLRIAIR